MRAKNLTLSLLVLVGLATACASDRSSVQPEDHTVDPNVGSANRLRALVPWPDLGKNSTDAIGGGEKDAAVIVALESYIFVPPVPGAIENGHAWQRYFTSTLGVPVDRVNVLSNAEATKDEIETALDRAAKQAQSGGRVWFVFIGHGAPSRTGNDGLLLGADVQRTTDSIEDRSLRQRDVIARLEKSTAQPVIMLDACFTGQTASEETLCEGCQPLALADMPKPKRALVLSAAKLDQVAGPLPGRAQPAFSYLALGALRGWGDSDGDGTVTADEVIAYTTGALGAVVKGRSQTPDLQGKGNVALAKSAGEVGPDLAEIQRVLSSGEWVNFNGDGIVLTELPTLKLRDIGRDEFSDDVDLSKIDIAKERVMEAQYLALQTAKTKVEKARAAGSNDPTGILQEKAWCELAVLVDPNPYRKEATKACAEVRTYVEQRKRLVTAMRRDWNDKVIPFMVLQHRSVADKDKVMQAFISAYGVLQERAEVKSAVEAAKLLAMGEIPILHAGMVRIAGGIFEGHMLLDFHMDITEVTVGAYQACVDAGHCTSPASGGSCNWEVAGKDQHPINCVSATDGDAYCAWVGARLPTEWEWGWVARSREMGWTYPWGHEEPRSRACWERDGVQVVDQRGRPGSGEPKPMDVGKMGTCETGSLASGASIDGVLDLAGNVWEWTSSKKGSNRAFRGGGWNSFSSDLLAAAFRGGYNAPSVRDAKIGFRCARIE